MNLKYFLLSLNIICLFGLIACVKAPAVPGVKNIPNMADVITTEINDPKSIQEYKGVTTGQSWFFVVLGGVLVLLAVVSMACKEIILAGSCAGGAFVMCLMSAIIETVHKALEGFVWFVNGTLILIFTCLVIWAVYKIFNYVPSKNNVDNEKENNKDVMDS